MTDFINNIVKWNDIAKVQQNEASKELYLRLILEEFKEFLLGIVNNDPKEAADGAVDSVWVLTGYLRAMGHDVNGLFQNINDSNYSKFIRHMDIDGIKYECIKREDGKIMKPESFIKADLTPFLSGQTHELTDSSIADIAHFINDSEVIATGSSGN